MLRIERVPVTDAAAQALIAEVQAEYVRRYGGPDDTPLEPGVFDPPRGAFFVGHLGDVPVAMGGWRMRPDVPRLGGRLSAPSTTLACEQVFDGRLLRCACSVSTRA